MKQHPILYIYLTRPTGAEGTEVHKKGPEARTHGIKMKQNPIVNIYLHPPPISLGKSSWQSSWHPWKSSWKGLFTTELGVRLKRI